MPPKKVAWLNPTQLIRSAYHVWLSTVAAEYLDRRETLAALNSHRLEKLVPLTSIIEAGSFIDALLCVEGGARIDYVADIGDSWEAPSATARLLVTDSLKVRGYEQPLDPAHAVVLGG